MDSDVRRSQQAIQVAVVGGGISGIMCAAVLMKAGVDVQVYEAASKFGEIGAGLAVGANATRFLRDLGMLDEMMSRGDKLMSDWFQWVSGMDGHEVLYELSLPPGQQPFMIHRAGFLQAIVRHVDMSRVNFNKRCIQVTRSSSTPRITMHFNDGTSATADVVIGADGVKSAVRGAVTGEDSPSKSATWSQTSCYRGLVPIEAVEAAGVKTPLAHRPTCFVGPSQHIILFAINGGKLINVVAFTYNSLTPRETWKDRPLTEPAVVDVTIEEVLKSFEGWGPDVTGLLGCIKQPTKWNISVVWPPLESYVRDRVALVGDSAHAMQTHLGAGAGQGLEDSYLLAKLLSHPETTLDNVETVLKVYDEFRRPCATRVWNDTYDVGNIVDGYGPHGPSPEGLRQDLCNMWKFTWGHDIADDVVLAERRLQDLGVYSSSDLLSPRL